MRIYYSGIEIEVSQLLDYSRTPVYTKDQTDYLYTKHSIRVLGLVSSDQIQGLLSTAGVSSTAGMSYNFKQTGLEGELVAGTIGPSATVSAGVAIASAVAGLPSAKTQGFPKEIVKTSISNPILTDRAIRHWLSTPRRKLLITNHRPERVDVLLESPKPGRFVDARNGPFADVFSIQMAPGDPRMFLVGVQYTTFVNECEENDQNFGAFLSNRFSQIHDINEDGFLVINTTGEAYFRTDLIVGTLNPDTLRQFLFLPVPNGFHRSNIKVSGNPDGTGFQYSFVDTQKHAQFVVGDEVGATRLEGTYRCGVTHKGDALASVLGGIERYYNIQFNKKAASNRPEATEPPVVHYHNHNYGPIREPQVKQYTQGMQPPKG